MQQSGEGIKMILNSCKNLKQQLNDGIFAFVFFLYGNSFVNTKIAGTSRILLKTLPNFVWWLYNAYTVNKNLGPKSSQDPDRSGLHGYSWISIRRILILNLSGNFSLFFQDGRKNTYY
jgi:hypothetical protein